MGIKDELLDTIQKYSDVLHKAGMRQAAGDYAYFVAWARSENWNNPLKGGETRLPPEPLGINTVDPYSNNCPIPYEKIVPINDYTKAIIEAIVDSLESLKSIIDDDNVTSVIENFIEASGKTEYSYNSVPLVFIRPDVDYTIRAGGSLVLHYNYKNTNYNVAGHLLGKYGKLNAAILRAEDADGNEVNISDLSLSVNGAEVYLVNNGSDSITLNKIYVAYGEWSYGVTGYNYTFSDSLENLNSNSLSALRLAPPSNLAYFDTDFLSFYKTIVGVNEVDCEEYQDYIWGKRVGLTVALYGTRVNVKNASTHNIENIHGIRFKNWFPETITIKSKVKFIPEKDDFDFNNVAYLDLSKDLTDITVDGIFVYDSNGNKIKYDISKVYHITSVFGGTFEYDDPGVSLFNKDGFIGIKKDSIFATDLAIHIKYSIADKPPAYCTNCGSKLDLYDVCHNTECILSPDYIEPPIPDLEYSVMSTWMNNSHTNGQIDSGDTAVISLGKYDEKYTTKQCFKIYKVYSGDEGADLVTSHSLALGQYGSSDMARIQNAGSDRILLSKLEYFKYNNACFVTNGQTFWSTTPVTLAPNDTATVKLYTSSLGSRGWGTYLYGSGDYKGYELVDVVLIDSAGEHRLRFKDKLKLNVEDRYSTIENISDRPFTFSYAIIKLVPRVIEYCDNCGEALDKEGVCHNTECSSSPDYIPKCHVCNLALDSEGVCRNVECPNSPDYIEYCPNCNSIMTGHICHNTECVLSPDYIAHCSNCDSELDDENVCHNIHCELSPEYTPPSSVSKLPIIGGELSLTEDTSLTKVFRAPLVVNELELVGSFSVFSLDEDEVI